MFLCDTSSKKMDSLFSNDFSFVFTPVKEKPQESSLFLACLQLDPLSDSFSSDFVLSIHWISPLMLLHRCLVELLMPPQLQPGLRFYTCHQAFAKPTIFCVTQQQPAPALALENSGVTWVGKLLPGSVITV